MFLNGPVILLSATLSCGSEGSITDNYVTPDEKGMFGIGITPEGILKETAYYMNGLSLSKAPNGQEFASVRIPCFDKITYMIIDVHRKMPFFTFWGFDVAIDENIEPVLIEYNVKGTGNYLYQYTNGSTFSEYIEEFAAMLKDKGLI